MSASPLNLLAFPVLSALALAYSGWIARLAIAHWSADCTEDC